MTNTVDREPEARNILAGESAHSEAAGKLETEFKRALDNEEFEVYYQPIVSLETSKIKGFEALVRWRHPSRGLLFPVDFLPVMERSEWIVPIGLWIVREGSRQMHQWHRLFPNSPSLYLSVNISSKLFQQSDLVEQISQILNETGLNPSSLVLEITETLVMQNSEMARTILLQLRALNLRLAIDDFGTGYSSLSYLQRFPVHTLKIDQSFIARLQDDKESLEIVRAIITLAHNLGLDVIAEGVEAGHHQTLLKLLKCECGQGYLYSKAVDSEQARKLIDKGTLLVGTAGVLTGTQTGGLMAGLSQVVSSTLSEASPPLDYSKESRSECSSEASACTPTQIQANAGAEKSTLWKGSRRKPRLAFLGALAATVLILLVLGSRTEGNGQKSLAFEESKGEVIQSQFGKTQLASSNEQTNLSVATNPAVGTQRKQVSVPTKPNGRPVTPGSESVQSLKQKVSKSTPDDSSFAVIHEHFFGSCHGLLKITSGTMIFEPSQEKKHGFTFKLVEIVGTEHGDVLKIKFRRETYRFRSKLAKDKIDNAIQLARMDEKITRLRAQTGFYRN